MTRHAPIFIVTVLAVSFARADLAADPIASPAGFGEARSAPLQHNCVHPDRYGEFVSENAARTGGVLPAGKVRYPTYDWPMENALNDDNLLVNYFDHDNSAAIVEYQNLDHTYDGHNGTDITLYSFRAMDRGYAVISAAAGEVITAVGDKADRNFEPPYGSANYIEVDNPDNTFAWYYHFRRNSLGVEVGETVAPGDFLGLIGSSGFSTDAHLHFETGRVIGAWIPRDPWDGPGNPSSGLWAAQEPYVGLDAIRVVDMGVYTQTSAGGTNNPSLALLKERLRQPDLFGASAEPTLGVWLQLQGQPGDAYTVEIRRPDNSLFASVSDNLCCKYRYGWNNWWWTFPVIEQAGLWTAAILVGGSPVTSTSFEVTASTTEFAPAFTPMAGKSFRMPSPLVGSQQYDTLRVDDLTTGPVTYSLVNAPGFVSLVDDSIVVIDAVSSQPTRNLFFQAEAVDASARRDTMWYHVVDPSKPRDTVVSVPGAPEPAVPDLVLSQNAPNPFTPSTTIRYTVDGVGPVRLSIYDAAGRLVRTLVDERQSPRAEGYAVNWDARDVAGRDAPNGVYFYRLIAGGKSATKKMTLLR